MIGLYRIGSIAGLLVPACMPRLTFAAALNAARWRPTADEKNCRVVSAAEMRRTHRVDPGLRGWAATEYSTSRLVLGIAMREPRRMQRPAFSSC